ncbi:MULTISPECIES: FtsB family cell division protein [Bacillus]|uniref:FtsB family cell division protein n=1 Tax=Bacillus TaxID=1386 RepID=UPI000BB68D79|nr:MULTISPECIES: septum formation initiator family protein [Bacillus]
MSATNKEKVTRFQSTYSQEKEEQQRKQAKKRKGLMMRLAFFFAVVLMTTGFLGKSYLDQRVLLNEKLEQKVALQKELAQLEKEQQFLEEEIVKLNDDEYIAKILRRDYFMSEEGEIIFRVTEDSTDGSSSY